MQLNELKTKGSKHTPSSPDNHQKPPYLIIAGLAASLFVVAGIYMLPSSPPSFLKGRGSIPSQPPKLPPLPLPKVEAPKVELPLPKLIAPPEFDFGLTPSVTEGWSPSPEQLLKEIHERVQENPFFDARYSLKKGEKELTIHFYKGEGIPDRDKHINCSVAIYEPRNAPISTEIPISKEMLDLHKEITAALSDMREWYSPSHSFCGRVQIDPQIADQYGQQPLLAIFEQLLKEGNLSQKFIDEVSPTIQKMVEEIEAHVQRGQPWNKLYQWTTSQGEMKIRFALKPDGRLYWWFHEPFMYWKAGPVIEATDPLCVCTKALMKVFKLMAVRNQKLVAISSYQLEMFN